MPSEVSRRGKDPIDSADSANQKLAYWRARTKAERIAGVETLRRQWLAEHDPSALDRPMSKVWRIVKRGADDGLKEPNPSKAMP